jgi:hypothetical protein
MVFTPNLFYKYTMPSPRSFAISVDSSEDGWNFKTIIVGSDSESSNSTASEPNWNRIEKRYVHEFRLDKDWQALYNAQPGYFARDVANICAEYEPGRIKAIRLKANITEEDEDIIGNIRIRLEYDAFQKNWEEYILELIESYSAPPGTYTNSEVLENYVWYDLTFFELFLHVV